MVHSAVRSQSQAVRGSEERQSGYFLHKVVLITGASSGIGRALAFWYLNNGARVALVSKSIRELDNIAKKYPTQAFAVQCDLNTDQNLVDLRLAVAEKFGRLDILINCAGIIFAGDLITTYPQDYDYMVDVHMRTPFILSQLFCEFMKQSQGCIINVSCDKGSRPEPGLVGYCMVKAGLEMLTKSLAMELAPFGIRFNAVAPSYIETNLYRFTGMSEPELDALSKRVKKNMPMQRNCTTSEVAKAIIFLTSEQ